MLVLIAAALAVGLVAGVLAAGLGHHTRFPGLGLGLVLGVLGMTAIAVGMELSLAFQAVSKTALPEAKEVLLREAFASAQTEGLVGLAGAAVVLVLPLIGLARSPAHDRTLGWILWAVAALLAAYPLGSMALDGLTVTRLIRTALTDVGTVPAPATISNAVLGLSGAGLIAVATGSLVMLWSVTTGGVLYARRKRTESAETETFGRTPQTES